MINRRLEEGEDFRWIVPVDYVTNLVDFRDSFILNKTSSKYSNLGRTFSLEKFSNFNFNFSLRSGIPCRCDLVQSQFEQYGVLSRQLPSPHLGRTDESIIKGTYHLQHCG